MANEWITTSEAADLSGYNAEYLRWLIREKKIEAQKFGIVWQVRRSSLITYMKKASNSDDKRRGARC